MYIYGYPLQFSLSNLCMCARLRLPLPAPVLSDTLSHRREKKRSRHGTRTSNILHRTCRHNKKNYHGGHLDAPIASHPSSGTSDLSNQMQKSSAPHRTFPRAPPKLQLLVLVLVLVPPSTGPPPFPGARSGRVGHNVGLDPSLLGYCRHCSRCCPRFAITVITTPPGRTTFRPVSEQNLENTKGGRRRGQETTKDDRRRREEE